MIVIEIIYLMSVVLLAGYGLNSLLLTLLYLRHRDDPNPVAPEPAGWPRVTVQLPIYNERHTVARLLQAAAALDYPRERLEIQVLDDSTDRTREIAARLTSELRARGIDILHLARRDRAGFKAGALATGLKRATGDLLAVFDADFLPQPDFLRRVVPHFADPDVGCVQARWSHLNRDYSPLTRAQALGIDGHFEVEQTARTRVGLFLNFNGTGGVWRRVCIEDAGGWRDDTLTEDLDLSYRAQLAGWRVLYRPDILVPAEVPVQISALKRQQARWAQGSIETALKIWRPLLLSTEPRAIKLAGLVHLTGYLVHPLMLLTVLLALPMSFSSSWVLSLTPWLMLLAVGPPFLYFVAQRDKPWPSRLALLPLLEMLGIGMALNNSWAILKGVVGIQQGFLRTPKFGVRSADEDWVSSSYALPSDRLVWGELFLSAFAFGLALSSRVSLGFLPWLLLHGCSFGYVAAIGLIQSRQRGSRRATKPRSAQRRVEHTRGGGPEHTPADCPGPYT